MDFFAEREGFEPPEVLPSTVFKTAAFNRSAISPFAQTYCCFIYAGAKVQLFLLSANFKGKKLDIFFILSIIYCFTDMNYIAFVKN